IVMRAAARHLASVTLEMGGKNPTIVDESADLENAAMKIGWGKCANCGQACVAPDYVLVDERIAERFVEAVIAAIRRMYDPDGEGIFHAPAYPRIVNRHHFDRLCALLDDALARGARIAFGGERDPTQNALSPTILTGVTDEMRIMEEEIFGPILPVLPYAGLTEVIDRLRTRPKPLALYIFSRNRERIEMLIRETRAGSTVINHNMIQAGVNPHLPFGGVNESGIGRAIGKASFVAFSNERSVVEQHLGWRDFSLGSLPPYRAGYRRALDFLFRRKLRG
ncbi:MAG: aldehyde dehydrogenase family protein, partial [Deltaproteobacteria bacterium]